MQLVLLVGLPPRLWASVAVALVLGVIIIIVGRRITRTLWQEVIRDVGIAFIVAGVVSLIYEYSTRTVEEHESEVELLNRIIGAQMTKDVWTQVQMQVIKRHAIRRNVKIDVKISREAPLPDGRVAGLPPGLAVLTIDYRYELFGLATGETYIPVKHELEWAMWNPGLQLPRFESVAIVSADFHKEYTGKELERIYDGKGTINLAGSDIIRLPDPREGGVTVITKRHELVNVPGFYYLVMHELVAPNETWLAAPSEEPGTTIQVEFVGDVPADIEPLVTTYYPKHDFVRLDPKKNVWTFNKIMLPGQGMTMVFRKRS